MSIADVMILVLVAVVAGGFGYFFAKARSQKSLADAKQEKITLQAQLSAKQELFDNQLQQLGDKFGNLANRIFEEKGRIFSEKSQTSLDGLLKPFGEKIDEFKKRIEDVHTESVKGTQAIQSEIKQIKEASVQLSDRADDLTKALKSDKKTVGNWGEVQLERTLQLSGLISGDHYTMQAQFTDTEGKRQIPDCLLRLPDEKHIIIDSKVSLIDYTNAVAADADEQRRNIALKNHIKAVRNHIDGLSEKDYSRLKEVDSPNFVLMFMPIEAAYVEVLKNDPELFNYGFNKNVILVSHTTLMPLARTIANLWKLAKSDTKMRELGDKAGDVYNQVCAVAKRLGKLGASLNTATNHYNDTVTSLAGQQGLQGKVERFKALSVKSTKKFPKLGQVDARAETDRLSKSIEQSDTTK